MFAQDLAVRFGGRVVLVGGALREDVPRDLDVRVLMRDDRFARRFDRTYEEWVHDRGAPWMREKAKLIAWLEGHLPRGVGADVSIWPASAFQELVPHVVLAELTPVDQRPDGCWPACLATLTGIPLDEIPHATAEQIQSEKWPEYHNAVMAALHARGWTATGLGTRKPAGFAIASGISPRDLNHAVVVLDGVLWHDPHPSRAGLETVHEYEIVVPVVEAWTTIPGAAA